MNLKSLSACLAVLGATIALAAAPPRKSVTVDPNDPRLRPNVTDPNDPEKTRNMVPPSEREALGLDPHTWPGIVQPEVYSTLETLNQTVETLRERLNAKQGRDVEAFDALWRIRFRGMVYVQVQLRDKAPQRPVLTTLKSSEFHVAHRFEGPAGFVGYATKEALDRLAANPDVTGVCLDDKPLPGPGKIIVKDILPPAKPEEAANQPGVAEGKVDPDVYRAFSLSDRVDVMVNLRGDSLPKLTDKPSEMHAANERRDQAEMELQDRVLSTVSADDFGVSRRHGPGVSGYVTEEGLKKLWKHQDVRRIYLEELRGLPEQPKRKP